MFYVLESVHFARIYFFSLDLLFGAVDQGRACGVRNGSKSTKNTRQATSVTVGCNLKLRLFAVRGATVTTCLSIRTGHAILAMVTVIAGEASCRS